MSKVTILSADTGRIPTNMLWYTGGLFCAEKQKFDILLYELSKRQSAVFPCAVIDVVSQNRTRFFMKYLVEPRCLPTRNIYGSLVVKKKIKIHFGPQPIIRLMVTKRYETINLHFNFFPERTRRRTDDTYHAWKLVLLFRTIGLSVH